MTFIQLFASIIPLITLINPPISQHQYLKIINSDEKPVSFEIIKKENNIIYPKKINNDSLGVKISANSALIQDLKSNKILWSKNENEIRSIASITKLMTAIILKEQNIDWEKEVEIFPEYANQDFNKIKIFNNEKIKLRDLFYASLISSSNNGIRMTIKNSNIDENNFVELMNEKAKFLNMNNTNFTEPTGLDNENKSTTLDLLILMREIFSKEEIKNITSQKYYQFKTKAGRTISVKNTNELIGTYLKINAGKTGYTENAGFCLSAELEFENKGPIIAIVLGSKTHHERFSDLKTLATWTFNNYQWQ